MNELIRELVKQAGGIYHNDDGDELTPALVGKGLEKFAELIVREMLVTCEEHPAWTGRMIGEEIKQHFGVKE